MRLIAGNWLRCELTGEVTHRRQVGYCVNAEGEDTGAAIVKQGLARAAHITLLAMSSWSMRRPSSGRRARAIACEVQPTLRRLRPDERQTPVTSRATSTAAASTSITCQISSTMR